MKTCSLCREAKPTTEFGSDTRAKDGRCGTCKACRRSVNVLSRARLSEAKAGPGDDDVPSLGETREERIQKNLWRARLVDGYMAGLATGDFADYRDADEALHRLVATQGMGDAPPAVGESRMAITLKVEHDGRMIAEFDASGRGTIYSISKVEAKRDTLLALRRAYQIANEMWGENADDRIIG